jgi:hypothetical protein
MVLVLQIGVKLDGAVFQHARAVGINMGNGPGSPDLMYFLTGNDSCLRGTADTPERSTA